MKIPRGNLKKARVHSCRECKTDFVTLWSRQLICDECKPKRGEAATGRGQAAYKESRSEALLEIARSQGKQTTSLADIFGTPSYLWSVTYSVPFSMDASKNRRWSNNGAGVVYLTDAVRRYSSLIALETKLAIAGRPIKNNKLWLSFFVEKPHHKTDAINVVDTLCDAIKEVVGLDDRWFCLGKVDWCIKKTDPSIIIQIAQEDDTDVLVCSHCGSLKDPEMFTRNKSGPLGRSRVCRDCNSVIHAHARKMRKAAA